MCPHLFGEVGPWLVMVALGVATALVMYRVLSSKFKLSDSAFLIFGVLLVVSILFGFVFAWLFQGLYNFIAKGEWGLIKRADSGKVQLGGVTFMGGLVGGVFVFVVLAIIFVRGNNKKQLWNMVCLAPICLTIGHSLGRVGCFLGGCCYGRITDSIFGVEFTGIGDFSGTHRHPTQLYEAIFLAVLFAVLFFLVYNYKKYSLTLLVYMFSYSVFRFLIEFLRDDYRGGAGALSPSQWQSIVMFVVAGALTVYMCYFKRVPFNGKQEKPFDYLFDGIASAPLQNTEENN